MRCPHCNEEISYAIVVSQCNQRGEIEKRDGVWVITDYGDDISVEDTILMQCPECMEQIPMLPDVFQVDMAERSELNELRQEQAKWDKNGGPI